MTKEKFEYEIEMDKAFELNESKKYDEAISALLELLLNQCSQGRIQIKNLLN